MAEGPNIKTPQETIAGVAHAVEARRSSAGALAGLEQSALKNEHTEALAAIDTALRSFTDMETTAPLQAAKEKLEGAIRSNDSGQIRAAVDFAQGLVRGMGTAVGSVETATGTQKSPGKEVPAATGMNARARATMDFAGTVDAARRTQQGSKSEEPGREVVEPATPGESAESEQKFRTSAAQDLEAVRSQIVARQQQGGAAVAHALAKPLELAEARLQKPTLSAEDMDAVREKIDVLRRFLDMAEQAHVEEVENPVGDAENLLVVGALEDRVGQDEGSKGAIGGFGTDSEKEKPDDVDYSQVNEGINQMTMEGLPDDDEVTEPAATAVPRTDLSEPQRIETPPDDAWERPVGFGSDDGDDEKSASAQPPKEPPAPAASTTVAQNGGETAETPPVKQDDAVEDAWRASLNDTKREAVEKNKEKGKKSKTKIKQVFKGNVTIGVLGDNSGSVHVEQTTGATGSAPVSGGAEAIRESGNREQNTAPAQETGEENSRVDQGDNVPKGTEATAQPTGAQEGAKIDLGETDDQVDILNARHENIKAGFEVDGKDEGAEAGIERGPQTPRERYKVYLNELREAESRYLRAVSDNTQMNRALNEVRRIASFKNPSWTNEERQKRQDVKNELREAEAAYTAKLNEMEERRRERMAQAALHLKEARARRTREGKESTEERDEKTREKVLMARHEAVVMRRTANMVELARGIGDKKDMQTAIATRMGLLDKNGTILPLNHVPEGHAALSAEDFAKRQATWNQYEEEVGGRKDPSKLVEGLKSAMGWYRRKPAWARHGARVFIGGTIGFLSGGLSAAAMASSRAVGGIGGGMAIMLGVSGIHHGAEKFTTSRSKKLIEGHEGTLADRQQKYLGYRKQERVIKRTATGVGALGAFAVGAEAGEIASDMVSASHVGAGSLSWSGYKPDIDINTGDYEAGQGTVRAATNLVNTPGRMWDWGKGQLGFGEQGPSGAGKVVGPGPETAPKAEPEQGVTEQGPEPKAAPEPEAKPGLSESGAERVESQEKVPIFDTSEKYVEWLDKHELVGTHSKSGISFVDPETNKLAYVCGTAGTCNVLNEAGAVTKTIASDQLPPELRKLEQVWSQQEAVHVHSADRATYSYEKTPPHLRAPHEIDDTGKVTKWEDTAPTAERATSLAVEGTYKPGESVESVLQDKISEQYPGLTQEELGKVAHRVRLELMKDNNAASAFGATGDNWQTVGKGGSYDFDLDQSIVDREISAVRGQVPGETPVTKATAVPTETTATAQEPPVRAGHRADSFPYVDSESAQKALNELSELESGQPGRVWQEMKYLVDHHSGARKVLSPWMEPPFRGALERLGDVRVSDLQDSIPGARGMSVVVSPELERVLRSGLNALRSAAGADSEYLGPKSTMTLRDAVHETFTRNGGRPDHLGQVALKDPTGAPQTLEGTQPERAPGTPNGDDMEHRNFDAEPRVQSASEVRSATERANTVVHGTGSAPEGTRYVQHSDGTWHKETTHWNANQQPGRTSLDAGRTSEQVSFSEVPAEALTGTKMVVDPNNRAQLEAIVAKSLGQEPGTPLSRNGRLLLATYQDTLKNGGPVHIETNNVRITLLPAEQGGIRNASYSGAEVVDASVRVPQEHVWRDPQYPDQRVWSERDGQWFYQDNYQRDGATWTKWNGAVPRAVLEAERASDALNAAQVSGVGNNRTGDSFRDSVYENRAANEIYKQGLDERYGRRPGDGRQRTFNDRAETAVEQGRGQRGRVYDRNTRGDRNSEYGPDLIRNRSPRGDVVAGAGGEVRGKVPIGGSADLVAGARGGFEVRFDPGRTARLPGYPPEAALRSTYGDLVRELRQDFSYAPGLEDNEIEAFKRLPISAAELAREPHTPEVQEALRNAGLDDKAHDLARYIRHYMGYSQGAEPVEARAAAGAKGPVPFSGGIDANKTQAYDYVAGAKANSARVIPTEAARRAGRYRSNRIR